MRHTIGRSWSEEAFSDFWYMIPEYENWATYYYPLNTCCRWVTQVIYFHIKMWDCGYCRSRFIKPAV